ncbi:cupin domain-containing protein [Streptomyces sp. NBC_00873]|uniref:cupin domain-containing protein n=1 Tax=unclassified Streptomyces TaxID=2593676 RepID=UPI0038690397|nr:cupin domain-containing protein [Streptomyces sp. NBC_00873]WTA41629.1 cupin domain-containing protein [Streptomyces sp. NBC_00842]
MNTPVDTTVFPVAFLADAVTTDLPTACPKPTSTTGQQETSHTLWTSPDGLVEVGVWECDPGHFTATREGYDEICQVLSGTATVDTEGGESVELRPGATLAMPAGWRGTWQVHETIRKVYVVRTHRAEA